MESTFPTPQSNILKKLSSKKHKETTSMAQQLADSVHISSHSSIIQHISEITSMAKCVHPIGSDGNSMFITAAKGNPLIIIKENPNKITNEFSLQTKQSNIFPAILENNAEVSILNNNNDVWN